MKHANSDRKSLISDATVENDISYIFQFLKSQSILEFVKQWTNANRESRSWCLRRVRASAFGPGLSSIPKLSGCFRWTGITCRFTKSVKTSRGGIANKSRHEIFHLLS